MRTLLLLALSASLSALSAGTAAAGPTTTRCAEVADLVVDGLLDDWPGPPAARDGDGYAVRCAWGADGLTLAIELTDDRVARGDRLAIAVGVPGSAPTLVEVAPGDRRARAARAPRRVEVADSLQPRGFSVEVRVPARALAGLAPATPVLSLALVFHDVGRGPRMLDLGLELADRRDLLDDLLAATRLRRSDVRLDAMAELDPDRRGRERVVAGGTVIGVLTDQFAYVSLPVARAADVAAVELLPLGARGQQVIAATVRQTGNGGSRDLLLLWTVWSGQLHPLAQIEIRKQLGAGVLAASWRVVPGKRPALWVEPRPAVGLTAESWREQPASDADPILLPWDGRRAVVYTLTGAELARREIAASDPRSRR